MAVVINQFEAVSEPAATKDDGNTGTAPKTIMPAELRRPMHRLGTRALRLKAH